MHLTITDGETDGLPAFTANVVDAGAPANEIETTFEMIEAGENVLLEEVGRGGFLLLVCARFGQVGLSGHGCV
jgi:hypothetical protein